ncbi:MAG TPA: type II toxin-antitoxin system Phd/YefM family antitoxin [Methylococcaceae bacterium]|nr:type II toxin-antitoxin system Phd/YefM family antitoxin [Methylococcaceae bacterium]
MRYSSQVKPISYLKANAAEVLLQLAEQREPMVITQNGEAKSVIQDVAIYEETPETLALFKILALGNCEIDEGKVKPVAEVVNRLRAKKARTCTLRRTAHRGCGARPRTARRLHRRVRLASKCGLRARSVDGSRRGSRDLSRMRGLPEGTAGAGIREYRQTFFKPYRVIYRVMGKQIFIYLIDDCRRDMQNLLARRLLGA